MIMLSPNLPPRGDDSVFEVEMRQFRAGVLPAPVDEPPQRREE